MMELEQMFSVLKLICRDENMKRNEYSNEFETIIYQFQHWCYSNKMNYNGIKADIYSSNPSDSVILQWFTHRNHKKIYNHIVDIIINESEQQQRNKTMDHHKMEHFQSYSSSNEQDSDHINEIIRNQHEGHIVNTEIVVDDHVQIARKEPFYQNYYYNDIDVELDGNDGDNSYKFKVLIDNDSNQNVTF